MGALIKVRVAVSAAAVVLFALAVAGKQPTGPDFTTIERTIVDELRATGTPGAAVAVVLGDRVIYSKAFGVASVDTNEPTRTEMLFRLGSTTKMFTAAALVTLAEQGKLDLKAPVGSYVTGINARIGGVTADQLLSHQSGLYDDAPMMGSHDETAMEKEVRSWTESRFFTEPGRIYSYSNPGYWFAGFLIEQASGRKYADQLAESLFKPLGMTRTTLRPLEAMTYPLAQGHENTPQGPQVIRPAANNAASWPAGSIFSNVTDLSKFVIAFMNDGRVDGQQVLSPAVIRTLSTPRVKVPGGGASYGYGLGLDKSRGLDVVSHGGSRAGYGSTIRMIPSKKFGVITLANRTGAGLDAIADRMTDIGLALEPAATPTPARLTLTAADMAAYAGTYAQGPRTIDVVVRDGSLFMKQNNRETPLYLVGRDAVRGEGGARLVFVRGASGAIEYLHVGGRSWSRVK